MFGISFAELFVILVVAVLVIPTKHWPDVARFLAQCVKFIRNLVYKISDAGEQIKEQIESEKPLNDIIQNTTDNMIDCFSTYRPAVDRAERGIQRKRKNTKGVKK